MGLCRSKDHNKDVAVGGMNERNVQRFKQSTLCLLVLSLIALFNSMACFLWSVWSPHQNTPRHCHKDTCQGTGEHEWCGERGLTKKGYCQNICGCLWWARGAVSVWEREEEEQEMHYRDDGTNKAAGQPGMKLLEARAGSHWVLGSATALLTLVSLSVKLLFFISIPNI